MLRVIRKFQEWMPLNMRKPTVHSFAIIASFANNSSPWWRVLATIIFTQSFLQEQVPEPREITRKNQKHCAHNKEKKWWTSEEKKIKAKLSICPKTPVASASIGRWRESQNANIIVRARNGLNGFRPYKLHIAKKGVLNQAEHRSLLTGQL